MVIPIWMAWLGCPTTVTEPTATTGQTADSGTEESPCVAEEPGEVCTDAGPVQGLRAGSHWRWQGIPFAAPPLGALRWAPPAPVDPWKEPRSSALGAVCPQWDVTGEDSVLIGSEDCLTLNVYAPDDSDQAPVLVFVHGGGHQQGDSATALTDDAILYDGRGFAEDQGAVVVTMNYRLGPLGFLAHPDLLAEGSANHGMLDQLSALEWVQRNIAAFGGDPSRVMVFGESAGAVSVCRLLVSPYAKGLFSAAGMQSGGCSAMDAPSAHAIGRDIATQVGCTEDVVTCLRERTVEELMGAVSPSIDISSLGGQVFTGMIDGDVVPDAPRALIESGAVHDVPVLLGSNAEETGNSVGLVPTAKAYEAAVRAWVGPAAPNLATAVLAAYPVDDYDSPRDAFVALTSDAKFTCTNRRDARALRDALASPVYRYHFDQVPENADVLTRFRGAYHGLELFYVFDQIEVFFEMGAGDIATQQAMGAAWAGLAATGTASTWPVYDNDERVTLLQSGATEADDPRASTCDFWDALLAL